MAKKKEKSLDDFVNDFLTQRGYLENFNEQKKKLNKTLLDCASEISDATRESYDVQSISFNDPVGASTIELYISTKAELEKLYRWHKDAVPAFEQVESYLYSFMIINGYKKVEIDKQELKPCTKKSFIACGQFPPKINGGYEWYNKKEIARRDKFLRILVNSGYDEVGKTSTINSCSLLDENLFNNVMSGKETFNERIDAETLKQFSDKWIIRDNRKAVTTFHEPDLIVDLIKKIVIPKNKTRYGTTGGCKTAKDPETEEIRRELLEDFALLPGCKPFVHFGIMSVAQNSLDAIMKRRSHVQIDKWLKLGYFTIVEKNKIQVSLVKPKKQKV